MIYHSNYVSLLVYSYTGRESHLVIETSFNNIMLSLCLSLSLPTLTLSVWNPTGDKPKLQELEILKLRDGGEIRIIESVVSEWEKLASRFGFEEARIYAIRRGAFFQIEDACFNMFIRWLNGEHDLKPPTWYNLIQCLEETSKFKNLARDVKDALSF